MAEGMNRVMLLGNLGAEPELRSTTGGQAVLKFRLACSETYLDKNRAKQERTEWVSCILWGARAEALSRILNKGSRIMVDGRLSTSSYDDKDGNKRYKTEVVANNIILCDGRRDSSGGGGHNPAPTGRTLGRGEFDPAAEVAPPDDGDNFPF